MDFGLNEQQEMLQKSARDFLSNEYSDKILKEMAKDPRGYTPELWNKIAELGWMALSIPEAYGGIGDFIDLTLILREMGRVGLISPFFASVVLGASTIIEAGSEEQKQKFLPAIAEGKSIFTLALLEKSARYTPEGVQMQAFAQGNEYILQGTKLFVPDANSADYIICAARTAKSSDAKNGITLFLVDSKTPGVDSELMDTISPDKYSEVKFNNVKVPSEAVLGQINQGWACLEKVMQKAAVAACAIMIGIGERVLDLTITYAKDRNTFGHPIGAYQAVQHRCSEMLIEVESSKLITNKAAWQIVEGLPVEREVAIAKAWVNQACRQAVGSAHQVHGAIGFSEDHILHWYTRRARALEFNFGDINFHLNKVAALPPNNSNISL